MRKLILAATTAVAVAVPAGAARADTVLWTTSGVSQCGGSLSLICAQWTLLLTDAGEYRFEITNTSPNPGSVFSTIGFGDGDPTRTWNVDLASFASQDNGWSIGHVGNGNPFTGAGMLSLIFDASVIGNPNTGGVGVGESVWFTWRMTSTPPGGEITEIGIHDLKGLINESDKAVYCRNGVCPPTVVPEPASMALLATGLFGIAAAGAIRRRKSRA